MRPSRFFLFGCGVLALAACDAPTSYLDSHELSLAAQQVTSLAGEAEWLAQQLRTGGITTNMAWVHQQALGDDAAKVARQLAKPAPPGLQPAQDALSLLDARLVAQVGRIAPAANRPGELETLQGEFRALAAQARAMEQSS